MASGPSHPPKVESAEVSILSVVIIPATKQM